MSTPQDPTSSPRAGSEGAVPMSPGDEAPAGTAGTGMKVCPACGGTGQIAGRTCATCQGAGEVVGAIGGG